MKKIYILTISLFISLTISANELAWVDEQVESIKPIRVGVDFSEIQKIKDPFIFKNANGSYKVKRYKKRTSKSKRYSNKSSSSTKKSTNRKSKNIYRTSLTLDVVLNNSALISGKWYRVKDKVKDKFKSYTLTKISDTSVVLKRSGKKLVLSTNSKNKNLKFKNN